jgi:plasmid stabilization system protein ParE
VATLRLLTLRFSDRARSQLLHIQAYIAQDSPASARRVGRRIREAAELLRTFPKAGRAGRAPGTREWVVRGLPYILVYELNAVAEDEVMILGVFHGAQDRP